MAWARIDDGFHSHPKIQHLSLAARGLLVTALSWAAHYETDGLLSHEFVLGTARGKAGKRALKELVLGGMFEPTEGGALRIHHFCHYNPTRAELQAERVKERGKKRSQRARPRLFTGAGSDELSPGDSLLSGDTGSGRGSTSSNGAEGNESHARAKGTGPIARMLDDMGIEY